MPFLLNETAWYDVMVLLLCLPIYLGVLALVIFSPTTTGFRIGIAAAVLLALKGLLSLETQSFPIGFYLFPLILGLGNWALRSKKPPAT